MERNKEMTCFQSSRTSANHWGRKEKKKKKKRQGKWRGELEKGKGGDSRNKGLPRCPGIDLPLTSTQLPINRPVPVLVP